MQALVWPSFVVWVVVCVSGTPCQPDEFKCLTGECVPEIYICDFSQDCSDGSEERNCTLSERCDFEDGLCNLQTPDPSKQWTRGSCLTDPGPPLDHTGNPAGHYLFVSSESGEIATAEISSQFFLPSESCTVNFYYHIGQAGGELQVLVRSEPSGEERQIWIQSTRHSQPLSKHWIKTSVTFRQSQEFQVIFHGLVFGRSNPNEVIAFDDLSFSKGCVSTKDGRHVSPASTSLFECGAGVFVDPEQVCDFTLDCPHGEDEANCPAQCDFETDACGWHELAPDDGFDWVRSSPQIVSTDQQHKAPPSDHSTNTSTGHYLLVLRNSSSFSQRALLQSPTYQKAGPDCKMTFWHYNAGISVGAAIMYLQINGMDHVTVLWRTLYHQGNLWHPVTVQLGRQTKPFQILVSKLSLGVYDGISALDDITFHNCSLPMPMDKCPTPDSFHCRQSRACVDRLKVCDLVDDCGDGTDEKDCSSELMCNFEDGLCSWTQDKEDMFDWTWNKGPTPTPNTGPFKDHTLSSVSGHYLFIESSAPQQFKDTAVLISRPFNPTISKGEVPRATCVFRFHYHMLGQYVFRLAVYIRNAESGRGQMLWVRHGDQGNLWHRKTLYINSARPFQILIEGTVGDDFTGDIAIDDLSFLGCVPYEGALPSLEPSTLAPAITYPTLTPHSCQPGQFVCGVYGECVRQNQVCDFRKDCSDGSDEKGCVTEQCDFEGGNLCGWTLDTPKPPVLLHAFQWLIGQGETIYQGEEYHRPVNDHTLGTAEGWYIYADSSNGGYGHVSALITPPITATGPQCTMEFWYYMSGFTVGTLQVLIKSGNVTHEVWSETGNQGRLWMRGKVFIGIRHNFQVILCSKRGVSYIGDVVVDDVAFTDCAPPIFSGLLCTDHEFACANGLCIPSPNLCDFIDHCGDGSDENHYICKGFHGHCNFEFDLCSWHQLESDNSDWLIKTGRTATVGTSPATDHTLRNPTGHYLYKENFFAKSSGDMARISSPVFSQSSRECKMVFYLHMSGEGAGTLSVYKITQSSLLLLLNLTGYQGNYWIRQEVPLISKEHFQVMFEGRMGQNGRGDISIDDITFSPGCLFNHDPKTNLPDPMNTGFCPLGLLRCDNGACYKPEQLCDFIDDCGDNSDEKNCGTSCSFEDGRCGWKSSHADNFDLMLGTGSAQSIRPPYDHTLMNENGHFLYLAATPVGLKGDKAHTRSFVYKESSATCKLAFWYYISHKATGVIRLFLKTENELKEVWMEQRMMPEWRRAEVPLRNLRNFELIFEVVRARDVSGGAALDDLQFINCARSGTLPGSCPAATDFVCNNGNCVVSSLVCDNKADCTDGSDELDCSGLAGACNFNMPEDQWEAACLLVQDQDAEFDWQIGHGKKLQGTGPSTDHSPDGNGSYLFVNSTMQREGDVARIITQQEFPASTGVCHLRFWFHMYGSKQMGTLKVYTVGTSGIPLLMWAASGNYGKGWRYSNVVLSNPHPFRVSFQAEVGGNKWTDIAIDDLSFTQECAKGALVTPVPPTCNLGQFQCVYLLECISSTWRCDGEVNCVDGSDEEDCGTMPPQKGCNDTEYNCGKNMCIPSLLRCDSVADCPNGEDEFGCPVVQCAIGELVCEQTARCIFHNQRCDHNIDCPALKSDESSCYDCPTGYCLNNGMCIVGKHGPLCICKSMWTGNRCHVQQKPTPPTTSVVFADTGPVTVYIAVSVAVILILAVAIGTIIICFIQRKRAAKDSSLIANDELDNYAAKCRGQFPDVRTRESAAFKARWSKFPKLAISVYPWRVETELPVKLSFSNPLYKEPKCSEA